MRHLFLVSVFDFHILFLQVLEKDGTCVKAELLSRQMEHHLPPPYLLLNFINSSTDNQLCMKTRAAVGGSIGRLNQTE